MKKSFFVLTFFCVNSFSSYAFALSCAYAPFDPGNWQGSVFEAKTISDSEKDTAVEILHCIKSPCKEGKATIMKEYWGFGKPKTNPGDIHVWTVEGAANNDEYHIQVCTTPIEDFWGSNDKNDQTVNKSNNNSRIINVSGEPCAFPNGDKWDDCESDPDCEVVYDACGWLTTVNKKFVNEIKEFNDCKSPMIDCVLPDKDQVISEGKAACIKRSCMLLSPKIDDSEL